MPPRHSGARADTSLRWSEPPVDQGVGQPLGPVALAVHHGQGGIDQRRVRLVQHDEHVGVGQFERPGRLGGIVEAEDGGGRTPAQYAAAGVQSLVEGGEAEGPPPFALGDRVDPEASFGDDPECALAAHEQLGQVGSGGGSGGVPAGPDHPSVGQHHLEADDHVLDLAVAVRILTGTATGQPPAHGGQVHRLGPVAEGQAVSLAEAGLDIGAEGTGPEVGNQRGGIDLADTGQAAQVEGHPAEDGDRGTAHAATAAGRRDRYRRLVAEGQHGRHLGGVGGPRHHRGTGGDLTGGGPPDGQGPPVPSCLSPLAVVVGDLGTHLVEAAPQDGVHRHPGSPEAIGDAVRSDVHRRDRGGPGHTDSAV